MSQGREPSNHSSPVVVEAAEILQKLTTSRLATLLFISDDTIESQTEMANILDISTSTISSHLKKLENLPVSLVVRRQQYEITSAGEEVIGLFVRMFNHLGKNLRDIDWGVPADRERIGDILAPLPTSRSIVPFLILHSVSQHSTVEDQISIFAPSPSVLVQDVVADVKSHQEERGETATRKQVRSMLSRFEEAGTIEFNDQDLILTEEGKEHAKLFEQLIEVIEDSRAADSRESAGLDPSASTDNTGQDGQQLGLTRFSTSGSVDDTHSDEPTIVPAYCMTAEEAGEETQSQLTPVLPLHPTATVGELIDQLSRIGRKHGDDAQLKLYWSEFTSDASSEANRSNECSQPQR